MTEEKKLEPCIPDGYKIVHDDKGWYIIPKDQEPVQPIAQETPV